MENNFILIVYSKLNFILQSLFLWSMAIPIAWIFNNKGWIADLAMLAFAIVIVYVSLFMAPKYLAKAILEIKVEGRAFSINPLTTYFLRRSPKTQIFDMNDVKSFKYENSYNFSTLHVKLHDGKKIKFHRWFFDSDDDFDKFMTYFRRSIKTYNHLKSTSTPVIEEKSIMENKVFLGVVGIIILIIFSGTIFFVFRYGVQEPKGWISLLAVIGPLIWILQQVVAGLRK